MELYIFYDNQGLKLHSAFVIVQKILFVEVWWLVFYV